MASPFRIKLPKLEDLLPEEVQYLRRVCRLLNQMGIPELEVEEDDLQGLFDADELGLDPEEDDSRW